MLFNPATISKASAQLKTHARGAPGYSHRKPATVMMTNELAGTCTFPRSLAVVVTGETAVGAAGVLASKRFALWSTITVALMADGNAVDTHPLVPTPRNIGVINGPKNRGQNDGLR